jgi:hypothetical protein
MVWLEKNAGILLAMAGKIETPVLFEVPAQADHHEVLVLAIREVSGREPRMLANPLRASRTIVGPAAILHAQ